MDSEEEKITFVPEDLGYQRSAILQYLPVSALSHREQDYVGYLFDRLSPQKAKLVIEYVKEWNIVKACLAAEYSITTSEKELTARHLEPIEPLIRLLRKADQAYLSKESGITKQRWLEEYKAVAFFDPIDIVDDRGMVLSLKQMPKRARVALKIASKENGKDGLEIKYTPYNKMEALKIFGQAAGYLDEANGDDRKVPAIEVVFTEAKPKAVTVQKAEEPAQTYEDRQIAAGTFIPEWNDDE